jgi:hypothetical protein
MKTSISNLLSLVFFGLILINCSKSTAQTAGSVQTNSTSSSAINPLLIGLDGHFNFNNNLSDQTTKLTPAKPTNGTARFSIDRKGTPLSALYLDGTYGLDILKVPTNTACSIALWIRDGSLGDGMPIAPDAAGLEIAKMSNTYRGIVTSPNANIMVSSPSIVTGWHHVVVTYDGATLKMYYDGQFVKSTVSAGTIPTALIGYHLGQWWNGKRWQGYIDELRFYKRALTATDVQSLYSL